MGTIIMSSASYILTWFNENVKDSWRAVHDEMYDTGKILYIGSQLEKCPRSGKLHWQAFVKFHRESKQRIVWFKKYAPGVHVERCNKERAEAINYGTKEDTRVEGPQESGIKPSPVKKFDAEECKELILAGREQEIPFSYILRYNLEARLPAIKEFLKSDQRSSLPIVLPNPWGFLLWTKLPTKKRHYWIFSRNPNKGKTYHFALPLQERFQAEICAGDCTYFNVTVRTECVIHDEYNNARFSWDKLNSMCDGTFQYRRMRQSSIALNKVLIVILSNQKLDEIYPFMNLFLYERFIEIELV